MLEHLHPESLSQQALVNKFRRIWYGQPEDVCCNVGR